MLAVVRSATVLIALVSAIVVADKTYLLWRSTIELDRAVMSLASARPWLIVDPPVLQFHYYIGDGQESPSMCSGACVLVLRAPATCLECQDPSGDWIRHFGREGRHVDLVIVDTAEESAPCPECDDLPENIRLIRLRIADPARYAVATGVDVVPLSLAFADGRRLVAAVRGGALPDEVLSRASTALLHSTSHDWPIIEYNSGTAALAGR